MMAFDFKKEYREFYLPKGKPEIIQIPPMHYVAVRGAGDPNVPGGTYQQALQTLYTLSYTLKMSYKAGYQMDGFFEYVVPPLEGFWWQEGSERLDYGHKERFHWISVIRLPDFVTEQDLQWAKATAAQKKGLDCTGAEFFRVEEGLCVQCMHLGSYDEEPATVEKMDAYLTENGYCNNLTSSRLHHEIYLRDVRKTAPEKLKTVIRHPIQALSDGISE